MNQHNPQNNSSVWKWLVIGGGVVLIFACGACVMARFACDSMVNGALDALPSVPPGSPSQQAAPVLDANAPAFTALSSHLHFNQDHREGPGASLLEAYADEDSGIAIRVFRTATSTRIAYLVADRYLGEVSTAERQAMLREFATEFENNFPGVDILIAFRGRLLFGASAIKTGASTWDFQVGASINEAPLHAFFVGILPPSEVTDVSGEAMLVEGATLAQEVESGVDCLGSFSLLPQATIRLAAPFMGLRIRAHEENDVSMLSILLRRPDGIHRCVYNDNDEDPVLQEALPAGEYQVWVGGLGESTPYELSITGTQ